MTDHVSQMSTRYYPNAYTLLSKCLHVTNQKRKSCLNTRFARTWKFANQHAL